MAKDPKEKQDVLDAELSKQLAWRMVPLPDAPKPPEPKPPPQPEDAQKRAEFARYSAERCKEIADEVQKAWGLTAPEKQFHATRGLLRAASGLMFSIFGMQEHPLAAIRLLRLIARHASKLKITSFASFQLAWMPVPANHPEMADLIVEIALSDNRNLVYLLDRVLDRSKLEGKHPSLGKRLAEIVDTAKSQRVRSTALRFLSIDDFQDTIPTLRRVLRLPYVKMRYYALFILVQMAGAPLLAEDVMWLLDDAVEHPLTRDLSSADYERVRDYESAMIEAIKKCPPPDGWRPLEIIAKGDGVHVRKERRGLDEEWAIQGLAAGYPERAIKFIDSFMAAPDDFARLDRIVDAIGNLPDEMARPRLIAATNHSESFVVEKAKRKFFEKFGSECPIDPLGGVPIEILTHPPSERMLANLDALRRAKADVRNALIDVLLNDLPEGDSPPTNLENHQRESLALLLFTLRTHARVYAHPTLAHEGPNGWVKLFLRRGGAIAFDVLARFAEEGVRAGVERGWLSAFLNSCTDGLFDTHQIARIREIAVLGLDAPCVATSLVIFTRIGAPIELADRLFHEVLHPRTGWGSQGMVNDAIRTLAKMENTPELDATITRKLEETWQTGQWDHCKSLIFLATEKKIPAAMDVAMKIVQSYAGACEAYQAIKSGFAYLHWAGRIDDAMIAAILADPDHILFSIAAGLVSMKSPPVVIESLMRALESTAQNGASAAWAASALRWADVLPRGDERIFRVLRAAPLPARVALCERLMYDEVDVEEFSDVLEECLVSSDKEVSYALADALLLHQRAGTNEFLEKIYPKITDEDTRELVQYILGAPSDAALYWKDEVDDEDRDDFDDDFDDDDDDDFDDS